MQPVWANKVHAASGLQTKRQLFLRTERATILRWSLFFLCVQNVCECRTHNTVLHVVGDNRILARSTLYPA